MAAIFTASDVLLAPTLGEGFGLTLLEAQACGTVAIANNFSAQPELLGDGWLTEGQPYWDGAQMAWFNTPNIPSIVEALEKAYARGRGRSDKAREHALSYDADLIWEQYWRPYLQSLAEPQPAQVADQSFAMGDSGKQPRLTIYVPAYRRPEVAGLLASLAPQLTAECEVIVSDDDPGALAAAAVRDELAGAPCRVEYRHNTVRLGGPDNLHAGLTAGTGDWVWMLSDDDVVLPDAVANILQVVATHDIDRVILLTPDSPSGAAGVTGSAAEIAERDPGLLIAATLITANVLRRSTLDLDLAAKKKGTLYGVAWSYAGCKRIKVMASPAFKVGVDHVGEFVAATDPSVNIPQVWAELLTDGYGVAPSESSYAWNFVSASQQAAG
jgi:hypothetical protein